MVKMNYPITEFNLEAPGGLIKVKAHCKNNQVETVIMESMPSFVGWTNKKVCMYTRGIRTIAKFRLLTKIDFNVMHLINLSKKIWQKLQIRGSRGLQNSAISDTFFQFLTILCSKNAAN